VTPQFLHKLSQTSHGEILEKKGKEISIPKFGACARRFESPTENRLQVQVLSASYRSIPRSWDQSSAKTSQSGFGSDSCWLRGPAGFRQRQRLAVDLASRRMGRASNMIKIEESYRAAEFGQLRRRALTVGPAVGWGQDATRLTSPIFMSDNDCSLTVWARAGRPRSRLFLSDVLALHLKSSGPDNRQPSANIRPRSPVR
jgi:hypothetical protein